MRVSCLSGITRSAGGLFYAVSSLCQELEERGLELSVFGRSDPFVKEDSGFWGNVSLITYPAFGSLGFSFKLRGLLSRSQADIVHQHGIWLYDQWCAATWQRRKNKPVIVSPHGMLDPWAVQNSAWKKKLVGRLFANESLQRATCIHALCQSEAASIRAFGLQNPIAIIPNGVELPELDRSTFNVPRSTKKRTLLFLGRIHPKKGLKELISAWSKVEGQKSIASYDWQLLIAGWDDGGYENGLKELASGMGLWSENAEDQGVGIQFIGPKFGTEKEALLRSVDAFILPSFSEGLPISVLEAWSYSLPVVMTDHCNLPEGFGTKAAVRIEPTVESIARGLEKLDSMAHGDMQVMGGRGRKLVEEKFTWPKIASEMRMVYEWCLTGENPPACMDFYSE